MTPHFIYQAQAGSIMISSNKNLRPSYSLQLMPINYLAPRVFAMAQIRFAKRDILVNQTITKRLRRKRRGIKPQEIKIRKYSLVLTLRTN